MEGSAVAGAGGQGTVTVVGLGTAAAVPDTAILQLGVETDGTTPAEALERCGRALDAIRAALRGRGVEPARLQTSALGLQPDWQGGPAGEKRPVGYRASTALTVRLAEPARAGELVAAAVGAGGDAVRVHSLALVVDDPAEALASARDAAWRDARGRAEQYAALAGAALGRVLRIEERAAEPQGPLRAYALAGSAGPAVEAGETPLQVATTVTWTLGDAPGAAGRR